ncbi:glycan-binding surface protein [Pedobacter ureilyticus]|uniref:Glycan-binding surface protein n=1 Tax=Pedobacter ureilyticus TaxID=1393051 RepID=A0ABW9J6P5_9SPHI|nr:glycan-binding surface protein [Pedobacter helvus]
MKTIYKRNKLMLAILLFCSTALVTCQKEAVKNNVCEGNGQPTITSVVNVDRSTVLTQGDYNQYIVVKGQNFCNLKKFMFNDIEVNIDQVYANNSELTVKIPNKAPENLTNKITLETPSGTVQYDFKINIPPVTIKSVENEYAPVGTVMAIAGQSFDFGGYLKGEGKVLFGNIAATIEKATVDSLYVKVPVGATQGMAIKAVDKYGTEFTYQYPYMDNTNMVVNYDDKPHAAQKYVGTDPIPGPLSGKYAHYVEMPVRDGFKVDQFVRGKISVPQDVINNPGNYVIKFETATSIPLDKAGIRIYGDYTVSPGKFHAWSFSGTRVLYTRNKWVTQTISLQSAIGGTLTMPARTNNVIDLYGVVTVQTGFNMDISFDNWRIVEKSKF